MATAAVVSVTMGVIKPVLEKLSTLMGDEYKKIKGLRKEVSFLKDELRAIDALLENMDAADRLDSQAKEWRKDIIDMSYDIEDCIDDFMHRVAGEAGDKVGILQKASGFLKTIKDRYRIANQIKQIKTRVIQTSKRRERYKLDVCTSSTAPVIADPRLSSLYKDSTNLVGIDTQKQELVKWVTDEGQQLKVASIVGFGGLGKTTLANAVYHEVGGQFNIKALVCVSQTPDMIKLLNSIVLQLGLRPYSNVCEMDLINQIRNHLQDKRYFVIVDDLWDTQAWDTMQCAFPENNQCSRVMITTRNENVARSCCANYGYIHYMKPLSEEDSRKLFFGRIFGFDNDCPSELTEVSSEILKKCHGLPLAIITMASMLACQPTRSVGQWEYIHNSLTSKFATNSNYEDMMYILDLSYMNIPRPLKACFLYLGSYPEDHEIRRVEVVRRWVAEGFVGNSSVQDVWDVAESYFNELVNRSMIQPTYEEYISGISGCRVHDMLLELIVRRCKEDNFLSLVNDPQEVVQVQDKVIRRLNVAGFQSIEDGKVAITTPGVNLAQIRSLSIFGESKWIPSLLEFKFVRVLSLHVANGVAVDLNVINQLSQMRYLKVEGRHGSMMLPRQIRGLRSLESLDLLSESNVVQKNSFEIVDAPRLSHLVMRWYTRLPDLIGKLKSLRTLHGFSLPVDSLDGIIGLGELTALVELILYFPEGYAGSSSKEATWLTALKNSLDKLENLKLLRVGPQKDKVVALYTDALSSLSPPFRSLERLQLQYGFTFSRVPRWIGSHLLNLRELWLGVKHVLQEDVVIIGTRLPSLVHLWLRIPGAPTGRIVIGGSTGFPALEWFSFDCDWMSFLIFEVGAMPELWRLELILDAGGWDKEAPGGLQHLPNLEEIIAQRASYNSSKLWKRRFKIESDYKEMNKAEVALIMGVFQEAADALPTRPAVTFDEKIYLTRPVEEEDYLEEEKVEEEEDERRCEIVARKYQVEGEEEQVGLFLQVTSIRAPGRPLPPPAFVFSNARSSTAPYHCNVLCFTD